MTALIQLAALVILPFFLTGIINRTKALWAGRRGPKLSQSWFDFLRLLSKRPIYSFATTAIFPLSSIVVVVTTICASLVIPLLGPSAPISFPYDFVVMAYMLALGRMLLMLGALDTGSAFEGMGSSREATFSAFAEPVLFVTLGGLAISNGGERIAEIFRPSANTNVLVARLAFAIALLILLQVEAARLPVDDPNTHLELTMIHEVMVLDHSGPDLAFVGYASALKMTMFTALIAALIWTPGIDLPLWLQLGSRLLVMIAIAVIVGLVESLVARLRMSAIPVYVAVAGVFGCGALIASIVLRGNAQ